MPPIQAYSLRHLDIERAMYSLAFLRYLVLPLYFSPLTVIVIGAMLIRLGEFSGLTGMPILLAVTASLFKYGFALLDDMLDGRREPPVLAIEMINPLEPRPLILVTIIAGLFAVSVLLEAVLGAPAAAAIRLAIVALAPAMIASVSISGRGIDALNPVAVFAIIARAPIAYFCLLLVLGILGFAALWIFRSSGVAWADIWRKENFVPAYFLSTLSPNDILLGTLRHFVLLYLWLATFACIGGIVYERRIEIGIDPAYSPERKAARERAELERERDRIMDRVHAQIRGGAYANAGDTVREHIEASSEPFEEWRWIYLRAEDLPDQRLADYIAEYILPKLLSSQPGDALNLVRERLKRNEHFKPRSAGQLLHLVQLAKNAGDRLSARRLLNDFEKQFPDDKMAPVARKLAAEFDVGT